MGRVLVDVPSTAPADPPPGTPPRRWLPIVLGVVCVVVFAVITRGSERPPTGDAAVGAEQLPAPTHRLGDLVPGYRGELRVVLAAFATGDRWLLRWSAADPVPSIEALGEAGAVAFDVSGNVLARHLPRSETGERRLEVSAVGETATTVAADAMGFAWHDRQPGRVAWNAPAGDGGVLHVLDTVTGRHQEVVSTGANPLRRWGSWGFALLIRGSPGEAYHFELLDAGGRTVFEDVSGYPFGPVPDGALGVTTLDGPGAGAAVALSTTDATRERFPVEAGSFVWEAVADSSGERLAMYENSAWLFGVEEVPLVRVASIGGATIGTIDAASRPPAIAWSADGRFVLAATLDVDGPQVTFLDTRSGESFDVAIEFPAARTYVMDLGSSG